MKIFRNVFAFLTEAKIPENISQCLAKNAHVNLRDGLKKASGLALLTESEHYIQAEHRYLFKYIEQSRKANANSVETLYQERLQKATEEGRTLDEEQTFAIYEQAEREILKYAPITVSEVFILLDVKYGFIWCSGSTASKCAAALKRLRRALGTLNAVPVTYDQPGKILARYLANDAHDPLGIYRLPESLQIPDYGKAVAIGGDEQKAAFNGLNLTDKNVRTTLKGMDVRTLEMSLTERAADHSRQKIASFELNTTPGGSVYLKGFTYPGGGADESGELAHHYAAEMIIISGFLIKIFGGLRQFFD